jgi:predicted SAM-dependent methyltransferase
MSSDLSNPTDAIMKLHLGCGSINLTGWINIDLDSPGADMHLDLRQPLPFETSTVDYVYAEHFIEHVERHDGVRLLQELLRVLKPGGVIRLVTPDLRFLCCTYLSGNLDEWGYIWRPATGSIMMNEAMRLWGHQFLYDAEEFESLLHESGFTQRTFQGWRTSEHPELSGLETRPFHQDLILEAVKPAADSPVDPLVATPVIDATWLEKLNRQERDYALTLQSELARKEQAIQALEAELAAIKAAQNQQGWRRYLPPALLGQR